MKSLSILDCTLRDGGFVNTWDFGVQSLFDLMHKLVLSNLDFIELGYLRDNAPSIPGLTQFPSPAQVIPLIDGLDTSSKFCCMIDYGHFDLKNLPRASDFPIHGLRITFKKSDLDAAVEYISCVKQLGYTIYAQPVSLTEYSDSELSSMLLRLAELNPAAVAIVDTYGLMMPPDVQQYFELFDRYLPSNIKVGLHCHNNLQMGLANAIHLSSLSSERDCIIDTSCFGMGKGAGNPNTELLMKYYNQFYDNKYNLSPVLDIIDNYLEKIYFKSPWGYSLTTCLNSTFNVHPNYVKYLLEKKLYSIEDIEHLLSKIPLKSKLTYSPDIITTIEDNWKHQDVATSSNDHLQRAFSDSQILVVGPGQSTRNLDSQYFRNRRSDNPNEIIISTNFVPSFVEVDFVIVTNGIRMSQISSYLQHNPHYRPSIIKLSFINKDTLPSELAIFDLDSDLFECDDSTIAYNSLLVLLNLLSRSSPSIISLLGFDGFKADHDYISDAMQLRDNIHYINSSIDEQLAHFSTILNLEFLTPSLYSYD
ncbi:MAG: hypothetical protein CMM87_03305 [Rickettsiales bacterium]|nr:hypothetical protein [Rickettsiales bacterium]